jgi:hypothetical protein
VKTQPRSWKRTTRSGYFRLEPFKVRKGDKVVALSGGKTAYVIRQRAKVDG